MRPRPPISTLFPYTTLFRSGENTNCSPAPCSRVCPPAVGLPAGFEPPPHAAPTKAATIAATTNPCNRCIILLSSLSKGTIHLGLAQPQPSQDYAARSVLPGARARSP